MTRRLLGAIVPWLLFVLVALHSPASALEECRLLRQPDIQGERIVFVYAGDLWTVPRDGGTAVRLTSHEGIERFPKFSPDGRTVAFTAQYDGNFDAFTIPVEGGEPRRLTWHPAPDRVAEWYPDGKSLLLRSAAAAAIQRYDRFYRIDAGGGFPELLPLPTAGFASLSPDGKHATGTAPKDDRTPRVRNTCVYPGFRAVLAVLEEAEIR